MRGKRYRRVRHKPQYVWKCICGWEGIRTARTATTKECPKCKRTGCQKRISGDLEKSKEIKRPPKPKPPIINNDRDPPAGLDFI